MGLETKVKALQAFILIAIFVTLGSLTFEQMPRTLNFLENGIETEGVFLNCDNSNFPRLKHRREHRPVIGYTAHDGHQYSLIGKDRGGSSECSENIPSVLYLKDNPRKAITNNFLSLWRDIILTSLFLIIGIIAFWHLYRKEQRK